MKNFFEHVRMYIFRGLLAIIPLLLCWLAVQALYVLIDKRVMTFLGQFWEVRKIPGLGILLLLVFLYLIGLVASNFFGRQILKGIEHLSQQVPLIKHIYGVGKQLSQSLSVTESEKQAFKKAVLVKMDEQGPWLPGFVMNTIVNPQTGEELTVVLLPTAPTPTSGFVVLVKSSRIIETGWTIEECLKSVVSLGIVIPKDKTPDTWKINS